MLVLASPSSQSCRDRLPASAQCMVSIVLVFIAPHMGDAKDAYAATYHLAVELPDLRILLIGAAKVVKVCHFA